MNMNGLFARAKAGAVKAAQVVSGTAVGFASGGGGSGGGVQGAEADALVQGLVDLIAMAGDVEEREQALEELRDACAEEGAEDATAAVGACGLEALSGVLAEAVRKSDNFTVAGTRYALETLTSVFAGCGAVERALRRASDFQSEETDDSRVAYGVRLNGANALANTRAWAGSVEEVGRVLGVLGVASDRTGSPVRADQLPLLGSLIDQSALVLERLRLQVEMRDVDVVRTRDRLRAALLSSVSHDLRTPLTAVIGAAAQLHHGVTPELIGTIEGEAQRLNRFVANLLDMARVEAGALKLRIEATDLSDAVTGAAHDARRALEGHGVRLDVPPDLPLVRVDPQLLHHCLLNLLDNAGRYGEPGTEIVIEGRNRFGELRLTVLDHGPGLPPGREGEVFETFRRLEGSDRAVGGTGLGLAIVKAFTEAMNMTVEAANRPDRRGAAFALVFPPDLIVRDCSTEGAA